MIAVGGTLKISQTKRHYGLREIYISVEEQHRLALLLR